MTNEELVEASAALVEKVRSILRQDLGVSLSDAELNAPDIVKTVGEACSKAVWQHDRRFSKELTALDVQSIIKSLTQGKDT